MTNNTNTCGEPTDNGTPCERDAGWGLDADIGPCRDHAQEWTVPDKLNEETKNQLIGAAQEGAFKKHCAQTAGITPQTLRNWLNRGEEHTENNLDSPLADLFLRFQQARAAGAVRRLQDARDEFVLERSYGYTKSQEIEHSGSGPLFELPDEVTEAWVEHDGDE